MNLLDRAITGNRAVSGVETRAPAALVLCGGGSRGAMEVGFYRALHEHGVRIDLILGSSIGALNGAYIAGGMPPEDLAKLWHAFRRRHALRPNWRWLVHPRTSAGLFTLDPLRDLLQRTLPVKRFEDLVTPLVIVTTDFECGRAAYWQHGDLIEPLIASMSLPGVFPPAAIGGRLHLDGALANNVPLDKAVELGARALYMIQCACAERCPKRPSGLIDLLVRGFSLAFDGKYQADLQRFQHRARLHVVRPQLTREINLLDFRYGAELIETAYAQTVRHIREGGWTEVPGESMTPATAG